MTPAHRLQWLCFALTALAVGYRAAVILAVYRDLTPEGWLLANWLDFLGLVVSLGFQAALLEIREGKGKE